MSDKKDYNISPSLSRQLGLPPTAAYGAAPPGVSYAQMTAPAPPSYVESLNHPVVASPPGAPPPGAPPQYPQFTTASAAAAASAQQLQMEKLYLQRMAAAQQAQMVAYAQQQAYQQQQSGLYTQQQAQQAQQQQQAQAAYAQQVLGYYAHPHAAQMQPGQNVLVMNGYDGARYVDQASISPPPAGMAISAAHLAAAADAQASASQKKGSFPSGGSSGGYTYW